MRANVEKKIGGSDWREAFGYAGEPDPEAGGRCAVERVLGACCSEDLFGRDDVKRVFAACEGANDDDSWIAVVQLRDGRYAAVIAWCDYTGWDCQAGGKAWVGDSLEQIVRMGLTPQERDRTGLPLGP